MALLPPNGLGDQSFGGLRDVPTLNWPQGVMRFTVRQKVTMGQHATINGRGIPSTPKPYEDQICPFCKGPLFHWPACQARILTDADPGQECIAMPVPPTVLPVACPACDLVLFTLRETA